MMGVTGSAIHEHDWQPQTFHLAIQLTVADTDPRLIDLEQIASARHIRNIQNPFLFKMNLTIQNRFSDGRYRRGYRLILRAPRYR